MCICVHVCTWARWEDSYGNPLPAKPPRLPHFQVTKTLYALIITEWNEGSLLGEIRGNLLCGGVGTEGLEEFFSAGLGEESGLPPLGNPALLYNFVL